MNKKSITKEEESELQLLRLLQADSTRWLSMFEFNRIAELQRKKAESVIEGWGAVIKTNFVCFDDHLRLD